ncbi:MAG: hypothetical protein ACT4PV_10450 [Planctomycetaceae bacterium]
MRTLPLLLLGALAFGAEPGLEELFDPASTAFPVGPKRQESKQAALARAVAEGDASALAKLAARLLAVDKVLEQLDTRMAEEREIYLAAKRKWWEWRAAYVRDYRRKHGQDPAEYPTPQGLTDDLRRKETLWKEQASVKRGERAFHERAEERFVAFFAKLEPGARQKPLGILTGASKEARPRAIALLGRLDDPSGDEAMDKAASTEKDPLLLAALLDAGFGGGGLGAHLRDERWPVRAAAIRALARRRDAEALALLVARAGEEQGRLLDDLHDALAAATGLAPPHDPSSWASWWEVAKQTHRPPPPSSASAPAARPPTLLGVPTRSKRIVLCLERSARLGDSVGLLAESLAAFLDALPDDALFALVPFGDGADAARMVEATAGNKAKARARLKKLEAEGEADLWAGLAAAFETAAPARARGREPVADTIVLVCGGPPTEGLFTDPYQIAEEIAARNALPRLVIHVLAPGMQPDPLALLATASGGCRAGP